MKPLRRGVFTLLTRLTDDRRVRRLVHLLVRRVRAVARRRSRFADRSRRAAARLLLRESLRLLFDDRREIRDAFADRRFVFEGRIYHKLLRWEAVYRDFFGDSHLLDEL